MIDRVDRDYHILERTSMVLSASWHVAVDFVEKKRIVQRSIDSIGYAVCWAAEKVTNTLSNAGTNRTHHYTAVSNEDDALLNSDSRGNTLPSTQHTTSISPQETCSSAPVESNVSGISPDARHLPAVRLY
jgi:hypothetical protein